MNQLTRQSFSALMFSPYSRNRPAFGWRFFGRKKELDLLLESEESFFVVGGRRMGKTSLLRELERRMKQQHKVNPVSQLLAEVPGIGPIGALSLALTIDPGRFQSGRHFAAWLGLTPKERSTGGRQRLGGISKAGNERLRQLLVLGATAVIQYAKPGSKTASAWLLALLERKPRKLAAVALANKMARIVWAMMASGEAYRGNKKVATQAAGVAVTA